MHLPGHVVDITPYPSTNYSISGLTSVHRVLTDQLKIYTGLFMQVVTNTGCTVLGNIHYVRCDLVRSGYWKYKLP